MREYPVPLSIRGEETLAFNLTLRKFLILLGGVVFGCLAAGITSLLLDIGPFSLLLVLPSLGLAALLAFLRTKKVDADIPLDKYLIAKILYDRRPRHYLMFRK